MVRMSKLIIAMLLSLCFVAPVFAANTQTVNLVFDIAPRFVLDTDKFSIDFGSMDVQDELWGPVGEDNSFKMSFFNNLDMAWEVGIALEDDLYRMEATPPADSLRDYIQAENVRWVVVYAQGPGTTAALTGEARNKGEETDIPGLGDVMKDDNASQKGSPFTRIYEGSSVIFQNDTTKKYTGVYQCVFKIIMRPPVTATAGTYSGKIIFTMVTQ